LSTPNRARNIALLQSLSETCAGPWPVLLEVSRKTVIGTLTGRQQLTERFAGSLAVAARILDCRHRYPSDSRRARDRGLVTVLSTLSTPVVSVSG
jgi:hypothetical protein